MKKTGPFEVNFTKIATIMNSQLNKIPNIIATQVSKKRLKKFL